MARLYVANCTLHNQIVHYRLDFRTDAGLSNKLMGAKSQPIKSGRQVPLGGDLAPAQIKEIIPQLQRYGGLDVSEIKGKITRLTPYLFSLDKPVPAALIMTSYNYNKSVKMTEGKQRRSAAALAASEALVQKIEEEPAKFSVEVEQEEQSEAGEKRIEEGFNVDRSTPTPEKASRPRSTRARA